MRKKPLQVTLDVREPSVVELSVGEKVQLDRLVRAQHGYVAERHGGLVGAGATTLDLAPGHYHFKTLSDANLKIIRGGVDVRSSAAGKDPWPPPPAGVTVSGGGDDPQGEEPLFTIT